MTELAPRRRLRSTGAVISVGECMVELTRGSDARFSLAFGGDTFNTAVYLARAGVDVAYATAVGDDPYSADIISVAKSEGVATDLIQILPGRMPGLYVIETTPQGERSFWYWRDRAAARDLFEEAEATLTSALAQARLVYFSGVTLSLYSAHSLDVFAAALSQAKSNGCTIAMDSNYRPRGWGGDITRARATFERFWRMSDIALPTFEDEQMLWGDTSPTVTADRLQGYGVTEIVVKNGVEGALVRTRADNQLVACPSAVAPLDTTAAGDSFNAGYLAQRLAGAEPSLAALQGHRQAAVVIQHRGAIAPSVATDPILNGKL